jgi:shikimate kinase
MSNTNSEKPTIILIGPMWAGKSTSGQLLAEKLELPNYPVDELRWKYYEEIDYDEDKAAEIGKAEGMAGVLSYWKPFEAYAVERILAEHSMGVIDFGAGHSVYDDEALLARVQQTLAPYPYVVLLLPSPDLDESTSILHERVRELAEEHGETLTEDILASNEHFIRHPSNQMLAKMVVYTKDKTPQETADEIVALISAGD